MGTARNCVSKRWTYARYFAIFVCPSQTGFVSAWIVDAAQSTNTSTTPSFSALNSNPTRSTTATAALSLYNSTLVMTSSTIRLSTVLSTTSRQSTLPTSRWLSPSVPRATSRGNENTSASPTNTKTIFSTVSPGILAPKMPLFAAISGFLGFILLVLLIYIVSAV